ncbi:MAG: glycosyltransferase [Methylomonas sp.]
MSKIIYVWEMGGGYGHTAAFLPVARQLRQRGHEVVFVLKDLEFADVLLGNDGFPYLQAPIRWPSPQPLPAALSYPGILQNAGFGEASGLFARVHAWQTLYQYLSPDLILFDHAPTALLAARNLGIPCALFGTGFYSPPRFNPLPAMRPWQPVAEKQLVAVESRILTVINTILQRLGTEPIDSVADLFDAEEDFLCTLPELDHYQQRSGARYWGPSVYQQGGIEPLWPAVGNKNIFAYVKHNYPGLETLLQHLRSSNWSVLVHIPGTTPAFIEKHNSGNLHISPHPLNLVQIAKQCDLAICHGGAGTTACFLLSAKPLLVLPEQLEQLLTGRNIAALGAGICVPMETKKPNFRALISELLTNAKYTTAARGFAEKYADFSPEQQALDIAEHCETLIRQKATPSIADLLTNNPA